MGNFDSGWPADDILPNTHEPQKYIESAVFQTVRVTAEHHDEVIPQ
jgi:hypothetical protein